MAAATPTYVSPKVRASGTTFAQLQAGGLAAAVDRLIAANTAIANPTTQATVNATGGGSTGGSLPEGTYYASYTWCNGFGETTAGTSESASFTISSANKPRITIPSLPTGVSHANIYLTAAGGASGTETLYMSGVTTTTYDFVDASGFDPLRTPPTSNTTAASGLQTHLRELLKKNPERFFSKIQDHVRNFTSGRPLSLADAQQKHLQYTAVLKVYLTLMDEIGVLIAANPGTIQAATLGKQERHTVRAFS